MEPASLRSDLVINNHPPGYPLYHSSSAAGFASNTGGRKSQLEFPEWVYVWGEARYSGVLFLKLWYYQASVEGLSS
jgi:hypothetical protein